MQHDKDDTVPNIGILYEDETCVVINKPSGLIVHEDGRSHESTVVEWFLSRVPHAQGVGERGLTPLGMPLERSGVVHRLDRDTSGVLVLAKTQDAFLYLKAQFHDRHVQKEYRAFVYDSFRLEEGVVDRPIGRSARDFRLRSAQGGARGTLRNAVTEWKVLAQSKTHAYLQVFPKTGRTHQIRVHLKAINHPIVMDRLYGPKNIETTDTLGFSRLALHAYATTLTLPNGVEQTYTAPLPVDFLEASRRIAIV